MVDERRRELAQRLVQDGKLVVKDLALQYDVTTETIRKDITHLEKMGVAKKTHGGAIYVNDLRELPYSETSTLHRSQKAAIARVAVSLIGRHVTMLDGGSTNLAIAKLLSLRADITVVTNSLSIVPVLASAPGVTLVMTGGEVRQISQDLVGYWATRSVHEVASDVCFVGANSIAQFSGPSTSTMQEVEIKRSMLEASRSRYLVVDSSKTGSLSTFQFAEWREFTAIITDSGIDSHFVDNVAPYTKVLIAED